MPAEAQPPGEHPEPPLATNGRAAFRYPAFSYFQAVRICGIIGAQMQGVAVAWEVYIRTNDPLSLGYIALSMFLPSILFALLTGQVADRYDRRRVVVVCQCAMVVASVGLWAYARSGLQSVMPVYAILFVIGTARAFMAPAASAMLPQLVPPPVFPNAVTWTTSIFHFATIIGPSLGGLVMSTAPAGGGAMRVYAAAAILMGMGVILLARIETRPVVRTAVAADWEAVMAGLRYVLSNKILLGAISLDMFAVLLGGAEALAPIFARDILNVGEWGLGMIRSAPAVGAVLMGVVVAHLPPMKNAGTLMLWSVAAFGVLTIGFGLSENFALSLTLLAALGAVDMISVVIRHTLVQTMTPEPMRGRVSAVNAIFINTSNELGGFESGLTARWWGAWQSVVIGGIGTIVVTAVHAKCFPQLRAFKRLEANAEEVEAAIQEAEVRSAPDGSAGPMS